MCRKSTELVLPVSVCVMAFLSVGSTPLLRVSTANISEDGASGVVKARELVLLLADGLQYYYAQRSWDRRGKLM